MDEIEDLLRSAERPRQLHQDELARIRSRVPGLDAEAEADVVELPNLGTDKPLHAAAPTRRRVPRRYLVVAAAAAVAILAGIFFTGGRDDDQTETTNNPDALIQTPLEQVCSRDIARLATAIAAWDGVSNWALTQNGEPALDDLSTQALLALTTIDGLERTAGDAVKALDDALAEAADLGGPQRRAIRVDAVTTAGQSIIDIVQAHPDGAGCALDRLEQVLAR